jgi:DNA-binding XRE family transcriptional regulator
MPSVPADPNVQANEPLTTGIDRLTAALSRVPPPCSGCSPGDDIGLPRDEVTIPAAGASEEEDMEQLASAPPRDGSFGALLRAFRHRARLSQEQLAARAELSERTVRNLEASRVRSPRHDTVSLLADALGLTGPDRQSWFAATWSVNGQRAEPVTPGAGGPTQSPGDAPARPLLTTRGFDVGNNSRSHGTFTMRFRADVICEFAVRAGPGWALPFDRQGTADTETVDPPSGGCGLELAYIEAVGIGDPQDASCPAVTCLIEGAGEAPGGGVRRITFDKLVSAR